MRGILDPELPIIDTHDHFWERSDHRYLLDELRADLDTGHNIAATIFLEHRSMYCADGPGDPVEPVLEAHIRAGGGRFRGVRHSAGWDASETIGNSRADMRPHLYRQSDFRTGLAASPLSACRSMLGSTIRSSSTSPSWRVPSAATIIMGHVGGVLGCGPYGGKRDVVFAAWKGAMTELAACSNVVVRRGGMMRRLAAFDYGTAPAPPSSQELAGYWRAYMTTCIELFGADRRMFASKFPVEKVGTGYSVLWNALKRIAAGASADENASCSAAPRGASIGFESLTQKFVGLRRAAGAADPGARTSFANSSVMASGRRSGPSCTSPRASGWAGRPTRRRRFSIANRSNRQKRGR